MLILCILTYVKCVDHSRKLDKEWSDLFTGDASLITVSKLHHTNKADDVPLGKQ